MDYAPKAAAFCSSFWTITIQPPHNGQLVLSDTSISATDFTPPKAADALCGTGQLSGPVLRVVASALLEVSNSTFYNLHGISAPVLEVTVADNQAYAFGIIFTNVSCTGVQQDNSQDNSQDILGACFGGSQMAIDRPSKIQDCVFQGNVAARGGALSHGAVAANLTIKDTVFQGLSSALEGGALHISRITHSGILAVNNSTFISNKAGADGAGIFVDSIQGMVLIQAGTRFSRNVAARNGGGVSIASAWPSSTVQLQQAFFEGNAAAAGGALAMLGDALGRIFIVSSSFTTNTAKNGGAIAIIGDVPGSIDLAAGTSLNRSSSSGSGGCIYVGGSFTGRLRASNSTANGCISKSGHGGYLYLGSGLDPGASIQFTGYNVSNTSAAMSGGTVYVEGDAAGLLEVRLSPTFTCN